MHWLIQSGFNDNGYKTLITALERMGITYTIVDVIPFGGGYSGIPELNGPVMIYGSQSFIEFSKKNWWPGAYTNNNFSVDIWAKEYGEELLNYDSIYGTIGSIDVTLPKFFIRPIYDSKSFSGTIMTNEEFQLWRTQIKNLDGDYSTITSDTMIAVSPLKSIIAEYRLFVVNSKVVAHSEYKRGDTVKYSCNVPEYVLEYANKIINKWQPDFAYCLDIAEIYTDRYECKVLEINCINGCGLYDADVYAYVDALTNQLPG